MITPPAANKILAIIHRLAAKKLLDIFSDKKLSGPIRRIRPENPIKKPSHLFFVIFSLRTTLAKSRINRGIDDRYMATSPVVIIFKAKGMRIKGKPRQKNP